MVWFGFWPTLMLWLLKIRLIGSDVRNRVVYRKPTHTERYLSFYSHHPVAHKRAVVKSLIDRAKIIPSSNEQRSKEMKHVTAALVANGYPKRFVIDVGKPKRLAQQLVSTTAPDTAKGFCILPYIKGTSEPGGVERASHDPLLPTILSLLIHHVTWHFDMDALRVVSHRPFRNSTGNWGEFEIVTNR